MPYYVFSPMEGRVTQKIVSLKQRNQERIKKISLNISDFEEKLWALKCEENLNKHLFIPLKAIFD